MVEKLKLIQTKQHGALSRIMKLDFISKIDNIGNVKLEYLPFLCFNLRKSIFCNKDNFRSMWMTVI